VSEGVEGSAQAPTSRKVDSRRNICALLPPWKPPCSTCRIGLQVMGLLFGNLARLHGSSNTLCALWKAFQKKKTTRDIDGQQFSKQRASLRCLCKASWTFRLLPMPNPLPHRPGMPTPQQISKLSSSSSSNSPGDPCGRGGHHSVCWVGGEHSLMRGVCSGRYT